MATHTVLVLYYSARLGKWLSERMSEDAATFEDAAEWLDNHIDPETAFEIYELAYDKDDGKFRARGFKGRVGLSHTLEPMQSVVMDIP